MLHIDIDIDIDTYRTRHDRIQPQTQIFESLCRGTVISVRAFGVFVRCRTLPKDALVHASQVDEQITLDREDPDDAKIQALTWSAPPGSEVRLLPYTGILLSG